MEKRMKCCLGTSAKITTKKTKWYNTWNQIVKKKKKQLPKNQNPHDEFITSW